MLCGKHPRLLDDYNYGIHSGVTKSKIIRSTFGATYDRVLDMEIGRRVDLGFEDDSDEDNIDAS